MSRSRRRHPFCGWTTARSEKQDKQLWHRRFRARVRQALHWFREPPQINDVSGPYWWEKDGKQRFDPGRYPELMRK